MDQSLSVVCRKYQLLREIASGAYGDVYLGTDVNTGQKVAVKVDNGSASQACAVAEARVLMALEGVAGVPKCYWSGVEHGKYILVLELVGESLESLMHAYGHKFSSKTVGEVARQALQILEEMHEKGIIHRDIKPENFAPGLGSNSDTIYILDFGLSKVYRDLQLRRHIAYSEGHGMRGTARFASINSHLGIELSRRDDIESLCYMLVYLLKGRLPWQFCFSLCKADMYHSILSKKTHTRISDLCDGCPDEFAAMLQYCRALMFSDRPDYEYLRRLLTKVGERTGEGPTFDWVAVKVQKRDRVRPKRPRIRSGRLRRCSERINEEHLPAFLKKKSLSETPSIQCTDTTCVAEGPVITSAVRLKAELLTANCAEKSRKCILF